MIYLLNWRIWVAIGIAAVLAYSHIAVYHAGQNNIQVEFDKYKLAVEEASKVSIEAARAKETEWNEKLNQERNDAAKRETAIHADVVRATSTVNSLRNELSDTKDRIAKAPVYSCPDAAAAIGELFAVCTERYIGLAEKADRHSSDVKTLIESWPK
jgi:hypothetical protein